MGIFNRRNRAPAKLPSHIAIIMDGNGRWAKKRGLPRSLGHSAGAERFREISEYCGEIGIQQLTVFAFSTENWKQPPEEVSEIMDLLRKYLRESCEKLAVKREASLLRIFPAAGRYRGAYGANRENIGKMLRHYCKRMRQLRRRSDILRAAKALAVKYKSGQVDLESFCEPDFSSSSIRKVCRTRIC